MYGIVLGAIISSCVMFMCYLVGFIQHYWDWWFLLSGILIFIRFHVASLRATYKNMMSRWLEKLSDQFLDDEKIYLTEASGIIMPPITLWANFFRVEAGSESFWCNVLAIGLFILSLFYRHYFVTCISICIFFSCYGSWLWQPGNFYTGIEDIDMIDAISLYYLKTDGKLTDNEDELKFMMMHFMHTRDRFYYLVNEEIKAAQQRM